MLNDVINVELIESWWDYIQDVVSLILTIANVVLVVIIYKWQHKDSAITEERQRRVNQFNNIFLIPRMDLLKNTFDELNNIALKFEKAKDDEDEKTKVSEEIDNKIVEFEDVFVSFISGIDPILYDKIKFIVDGMRDDLSHEIFDTDTSKIKGGVYVQVIQKRINTGYKILLSALFSYDGKKEESIEMKETPSNFLTYILLTVIIVLLGILVGHFCFVSDRTGGNIQSDSTQIETIVNTIQSDTIINE